MKRNKKNTNRNLFLAGTAVAVVLVLVVVLIPAINKTRDKPGDPNAYANGASETEGTSNNRADRSQENPNGANSMPLPDSPKVNPIAEAARKLLQPMKGPMIELQDVVKAAKTWMPVEGHSKWFGRTAPDFSVVDIDSKQHTLSGLKGKHVIIVLWAQWFSSTLGEITKLTELRNNHAQDELAILGISFDDATQVSNYVNKKAINFPMIAAKDQGLPAPYSQGELPGAFFITPDGILKLSTRGPIPLEEIEKILQAQ